LPKCLLIYAIDLAGLRVVDQIEQSRKGIAQIEAERRQPWQMSKTPFEFLL